MVKAVGEAVRSEFVLDATEAWRRGRVIDAMLRPTRRQPKGVQRAAHRVFNEIDDRLELERARTVAAAPRATPPR